MQFEYLAKSFYDIYFWTRVIFFSNQSQFITFLVKDSESNNFILQKILI